MPEIVGIEKIFSVSPSRKFGKDCPLGHYFFGYSDYGDEEIIYPFSELGNSSFGIDRYANFILLSGIYRRDNVTGKIKYYREPYYITKNPRTGPQQTNRGKMANGMVEWKDLTNLEQEVYNQRAIGKHMSGMNLFLKEYLLSH